MIRIVDRDSAIAEPDQPRIAADERDVGRLDRHVRAGPDGDAEVRPGERRGVVDAVADHRDRGARPPGAARSSRPCRPGSTSAITRSAGIPTWRATASAVTRASPVSSHTSMPAARSSRTASADSALTGSEMATRPAAAPSTATNTTRPALGRRGIGRRRERAQVHAALRQQPPDARRPPRRHRSARARPAPTIASNASAFAKPELRLAGPAHDRRAQRVLRARSPARRPDRGRAPPSKPGRGNDRDHRGLAQRERPGLVEDDGVDPARGLERLAAADEDPRLGALAGADHDRRRRGEAHGARAGDDHDADERGQRERQARLRPERRTRRRTSARRRRGPPGRRSR